MCRVVVDRAPAVFLSVVVSWAVFAWAARLAADEPAGAPEGTQSASAGPPAGLPAGGVVLGDTSFWRWFAMSRPPVLVQGPDDAADERTALFSKKPLTAAEANTLYPAPPAGWNQPGFDDASWPRSMGGRLALEACAQARADAQDGDYSNSRMGQGAAALLVRGRFNVRDPGRVRDMTLSLTVTGGAVVYVNGRRLAAVGLPDGDIPLHAPAAPYAEQQYVDANGRPIPGLLTTRPYDLAGAVGRGRLDEGAVARAEGRKRRLDAVAVPGDWLRAGVNVVAVEVHRSDFCQAANAWFPRGQMVNLWPHLCIWDLRLSADPNGAVEPNTRRPEGLQVWNLDRNAYLTGLDYGDPTEPLRPILLAGARNGTLSGRVVASSRVAIRGLKAQVSDLVGADATHAIAAEGIDVQYSDDLQDTPPDEVAATGEDGAVCSVWVRVRVPRDCPAGRYRGALTVTADGAAAVRVPVELSVADWTIPDPLDFRTKVAVYQSISSVAMQYKVPMWSEQHWKLLDRSFALLAGLGCRFASISVVDQGMLGDEEGAVLWSKKPDGTYDYDCSILERYLKLVKSRLGKCPYIVLGIWQVPDSGYVIIDTKLAPGTTVTVIDPATGKKEHLAAPTFGTPESEAFWRPVMLGIREVFRRCDLESSMCLGYCHEGPGAPAPVLQMFDDILGRTRWFQSSHPPDYRLEPKSISDRGTMDYHEVVYTRLQTRLAPIGRLLRSPNLLYVRRPTPYDLIVWRSTPDWAIANGQSGFGHIGLDFWPLDLKETRVRQSGVSPFSLYGRFPRDNGWPGPLCPPALARPGKDGACPTPAYEALREGLQEFEAAAFALDAAETQSAKIGEDLTRRAKALFAEKRAALDRGIRYRRPATNVPDFAGWQDLSRRTFELAAEIDKALRP